MTLYVTRFLKFKCFWLNNSLKQWLNINLHIAFENIEWRNRRVSDAAAQHPADRTRRVIRRRVHFYFLVWRRNRETLTVRWDWRRSRRNQRPWSEPRRHVRCYWLRRLKQTMIGRVEVARDQRSGWVAGLRHFPVRRKRWFLCLVLCDFFSSGEKREEKSQADFCWNLIRRFYRWKISLWNVRFTPNYLHLFTIDWRKHSNSSTVLSRLFACQRQFAFAYRYIVFYLIKSKRIKYKNI